MKKNIIRARWSALALVASLGACGGGGSSAPPPPAPAPQVLAISGTAAVGLALANATVQIKCVDGSTQVTSQTTTQADGSYSASLSGASLPCALRVTASDGSRLHSLAVGTGQRAVANITPLTELLVARAARQDAPAYFDAFNPATLASGSALQAAQADIRSLLNGVVDVSAVADFVATPLKAATPGQRSDDVYDRALDALKERVEPTVFGEWARLLASGGPLPDPASFVPQLSTLETRITLAAEQSHRFSALTNYPPHVRYLRQPVSWSVVEADGGRIDGLSGAYTAPSKPGVYHVKVVRDDFAGLSATVELTVLARDAFVPRLSVPARTVQLRTGQSHSFSADLNYPPNVIYIRQPVRWAVLETGGGSIDALSGRYTAPAQTGVFHVQATREDFPSVNATVQVEVRDHAFLNYRSAQHTSGYREHETLVVRDAAAWANLLQRWDLQPRDPSAPDMLDFSRDMVIAIATTGPNGCSSLQFEGTREAAGKLVASYRISSGLPGAICTQALVDLVALIVLPRSDLPVEIVRLD